MQTVEMTIETVAYRGRAVARHEGRVVFVAGALPGEQVLVTIHREHRNFAEARLLEVLKPAGSRIEPECPLAVRACADTLPPAFCPGCTYQHVAYEDEVRFKQSQFEDLLRRFGGITSAPMAEPVPSPQPLYYRNKIVLQADGAMPPSCFGYVGDDNRSVIDVPRCPLARQPINTLLEGLRRDAGFLATLAPRARVLFRWTETDGARFWTLDGGKQDLITETTSVGPIRVPAASFFQVNPAVAEHLLVAVTEALRGIAPGVVLDLYCGAGLFALAAAGAGVTTVEGVDSDRDTIRAANANARRNNAKVRFHAGAAEEILESLLSSHDSSQTALIVDPPRQGLTADVLDAIDRHPPCHILYVSCAPDTLARDLRRLTGHDYAVTACRLFDMFPRTPYFESLTVLTHNRHR